MIGFLVNAVNLCISIHDKVKRENYVNENRNRSLTSGKLTYVDGKGKSRLAETGEEVKYSNGNLVSARNGRIINCPAGNEIRNIILRAKQLDKYAVNLRKRIINHELGYNNRGDEIIKKHERENGLIPGISNQCEYCRVSDGYLFYIFEPKGSYDKKFIDFQGNRYYSHRMLKKCIDEEGKSHERLRNIWVESFENEEEYIKIIHELEDNNELYHLGLIGNMERSKTYYELCDKKNNFIENWAKTRPHYLIIAGYSYLDLTKQFPERYDIGEVTLQMASFEEVSNNNI